MAVTPSCALIAARVAAGEWADVRTLDAEHRAVSARFIRQLLLALPIATAEHEQISAHHPEYACFVPRGEYVPVPVPPTGVRVRGAIIEGKLDLADCISPGGLGLPALALEDCRLVGERLPITPGGDVGILSDLDLSRSHIARLSLKGSRFAHARARESIIDGGVDLSGVQPDEEWVPRPWPGVDMKAFRATMMACKERMTDCKEAMICKQEMTDCKEVMTCEDPWETISSSTEKEILALFLPPASSGTSDALAAPGSRLEPVDAICWVNLSASEIRGEVNVIDAKFRTPPPRPEKSFDLVDTRYGLRLDRAVVDGSLIAYGESVFDGGLNISLAEIKGEVWLGGASLIRGEGSALDAQGAAFGGLYATDRERPLEVFGGMFIDRARVAGPLDLKGGNLDGAGGIAFGAEGATVDGDILLRDGFAARGPIRMSGARIGGMLNMTHAIIGCNENDFENSEGMKNDSKENDVFDGQTLDVKCSMLFSDAIVKGCIWLKSAKIGDSLYFDKAHLLGSVRIKEGEKCAIHGTDITVGANVQLDCLNAIGTVRFQRAQIGSDYCLHKAKIYAKSKSGPADNSDASNKNIQDAIDLAWATIAGNLIFNRNKLTGKVRLTHTNAAVLCDHDGGYDCASKLDLNGFEYQSLYECRILTSEEKDKEDEKADEAKDSIACKDSRISWLNRMYPPYEPQPYEPKPCSNLAKVLFRLGRPEDEHDHYEPQPYVNLAKVLFRQGRPEDARDIAVEKHNKEKARRKGIFRLSYFLFGSMFGYGLKPARAMTTIVAAIILGWIIFATANSKGALVVDQQAIAGSVRGEQMGAAVSKEIGVNLRCADAISPLLYALDVFIPLVDLRQESKCEVGAAHDAKNLFPGFTRFDLGNEVWIYRIFKVLYALSGWLIISLSILTFSGVLERRENR